MNIELTLLLTIISVGAAVLFGLSNYNRSIKKDGEKSGRIIQDLDDIKNTVEKTDTKIDKLAEDANSFRERLRVVEHDHEEFKSETKQSIKRIHERIDKIHKEVQL